MTSSCMNRPPTPPDPPEEKRPRDCEKTERERRRGNVILPCRLEERIGLWEPARLCAIAHGRRVQAAAAMPMRMMLFLSPDGGVPQ